MISSTSFAACFFDDPGIVRRVGRGGGGPRRRGATLEPDEGNLMLLG